MRTLITIFLILNISNAYSQEFTFEVGINGFANNLFLEEYRSTTGFPITNISTRHETKTKANFSIDTKFIYELSDNLKIGINLGYSGTKIDYFLYDFHNASIDACLLYTSPSPRDS